MTTITSPQTGYAPVNGLEMYYEIHGTGAPLVMLHGAYMSISTMGEIIPRLAESRQVIAVELQGHGRTADIDRPFSYEAMADDVAALMQHLEIEKADIFGYSMGGSVALQVAIHHPQRVNKLVVASAGYNSGAFRPGFFEMVQTMTPELFAGTPIEEDYKRLAPNPDDFPRLVEKLVQLDSAPHDWPAEDIQGITAPTFIIVGDSDAVPVAHALEMFRLLGGDVDGDLAGLPSARLAVLPASSHIGVMFRPDWLHSMIVEFLDAPAAQGG